MNSKSNQKKKKRTIKDKPTDSVYVYSTLIACKANHKYSIGNICRIYYLLKFCYTNLI